VVFFVFFILFLKSGTIQIVFIHNYILYTFGMFKRRVQYGEHNDSGTTCS
jgi:hypothetical protein